MKVLFLDIDGVLNSAYTQERSKTGFLGLQKTLVKRFVDWKNKHPDVRVVLSSTWRTDPVMKQEVRDAGIDFMDETPIHDNGIRGKEIEAWLKSQNNVTHYVIVDDNTDMLTYQQPYFVKTNAIRGLLDQDLEKINKILEE